jgi:hypothetical protein
LAQEQKSEEITFTCHDARYIVPENMNSPVQQFVNNQKLDHNWL